MSSPATLPSSPLELAFPQCDLGIGKVIQSSDSPDLIDGVRIKPYPLWPDDRGYFLEVLRLGNPYADLGESVQVSAALSYVSTIKAFHYHLHQTDLWVPVRGMFQVVLVDLRKQSSTFGLRNTLYVGHLRPWQITIPPGVGHGYKILGTEPGLLVYVTNRFYDPSDEGRIPYNHSGIHYDWETQHK
jgi:dTDP-4-dehydrorhamnose 3,5-epimerase